MNRFTKMAYSIEEVSSLTSLSKPFLRLEISRGKLKAQRFGRRVLVLDKDLQEYLKLGSEGANSALD